MKTVHATIMNSHGFIRASIVDEGTLTQIASSADPATGYKHCAVAIKQWAADNGYDCPPFIGTACLTRNDSA